MAGIRFDLKPHPIIEMGISYLAIFDGEGKKSMDFNDYMKALFGDTGENAGTKAGAIDRPRSI